MVWSEVQITTTNEAEEAVAEAFYEAGAGGVAIESTADLEPLYDEFESELIDASLLDRAQNTSIIRGYFPVDGSDQKISDILVKIARLPQFGLDPGSGELKIVEVRDEDWEESWKKFFVAQHVTPDVVVVPTWENYKSLDGEIVISMDPGMAFGTGSHETTRLCCKLIEKYMPKNAKVIDVGTGSGILAITAAKLGAKNVLAIDLDPIAVKVAGQNVDLNDTENVEVREGDLLADSTERANLIVANILKDPILKLIPQVYEALEPEGLFICSGLLPEHTSDVVEALEETSFNVLETADLNGWSAVVAEKL